jgi:hypothetical protein
VVPHRAAFHSYLSIRQVGFLLSYCTNQWPSRAADTQPAVAAALAAAADAADGAAGAAPPELVVQSAAAATASSSVTGGGSGPGGSGSGGGGSCRSTSHAGLVHLLNEVLLLIGYYGESPMGFGMSRHACLQRWQQCCTRARGACLDGGSR